MYCFFILGKTTSNGTEQFPNIRVRRKEGKIVYTNYPDKEPVPPYQQYQCIEAFEKSVNKIFVNKMKSGWKLKTPLVTIEKPLKRVEDPDKEELETYSDRSKVIRRRHMFKIPENVQIAGMSETGHITFLREMAESMAEYARFAKHLYEDTAYLHAIQFEKNVLRMAPLTEYGLRPPSPDSGIGRENGSYPSASTSGSDKNSSLESLNSGGSEDPDDDEV